MNETTLYRLERAIAIEFWLPKDLPLPRFAKAVCAWCGAYTSFVHTHHAVIPKNYGVVVDAWWNLVPLCPHCHNRAHSGSRDDLILRLARRICNIHLDMYHLNPTEDTCTGLLWLQSQINALKLKFTVPLPTERK